MNIEIRLLNSVLSKEVYTNVAGIFNPSSFTDELEDIASAIIELHNNFNCDLDFDIIGQHLKSTKVNTTAKKLVLDEMVSKIVATKPVDTEVARKFIFNLARKRQRLDALNRLAQIIEGNEETHTDVISMLSELPQEESDDAEIVGSDLKDLGEHYTLGGEFKFGISALQDAIGGLGRGNLAIVFGRPEVGKSSFIAHEVAGYIKNGMKVEYYANEEPGRKIMLNIRRAVTKETDEEIRKCLESNKDNEDWVAVKSNLTVRQVGDIEVDLIATRAKESKPDIIILDKVDKMSLSGKFNNTADRLKALYERTRVIAKTGNCLVVNISQASAEAEGKVEVTYSHLENSKTGKAGEADIIIGIGKYEVMSNERVQTRSLTISKNKINGWLDRADVTFDRYTNQWSGNL